jgi:hypothetical protein
MGDGARCSLGLASQFHEYCLSEHRRESRKAYLEADMTVAVARGDEGNRISISENPSMKASRELKTGDHGLELKINHGPSEVGQDAPR